MSCAQNHMARSHRSQYRARAFNGARHSVVKPTARKMDYFSWFRQIGSAIRRKASAAGRKPDEPV